MDVLPSIFFYILGAAFFLLPRFKKNFSPAQAIPLKVFSAIFLTISVYGLHANGALDVFGAVLAVSTIASGSIISLYAYDYFRINNYSPTASTLLDLLILCLITTYASFNILALATFWTISEVLAYALIKEGEEHSYEGSLTSSRGFIFTSTLTFEVTVFTMIITSVLLVAGAMSFQNLLKSFTDLATIKTMVPAYLIPLLIAGFVTKAATVPLHFWLPSAHSAAPSPASALLSGVMTPLGFLGLYRVVNLVDFGEYEPIIAFYLIVSGIFSIIYGGLQAAQQRDGKKMLAYATVSTNGFISLVFALYLLYPGEYVFLALLTSIVMHTAYKTTLFAEMGLVEYTYGSRYIHGLHGVSTIMPVSSIGGLLAVFTMLGIPGTIGFTSKFLSIYAILYQGLDLAKTIILLGIAFYIATTISISINYFKIYLKKGKGVLQPVQNVDLKPQVAILALGALNVLYNLTILISGFSTIALVVSFTMMIPVLVATLFSVTFRGVSPREHAG
ncbi:proton-conducting transporter transmembrane domain-containing protein [Thermosphaera sp.]